MKTILFCCAKTIDMSDELSTEYESSVEQFDNISNFESYDELELPISLKQLSLKPSKKTTPANQQSKSFTRARITEIERHNLNLLRRINSAKSTINQFRNGSHAECATKTATATINRKKVEQKIEYENGILRRKLEAIGRRRHSISF